MRGSRMCCGPPLRRVSNGCANPDALTLAGRATTNATCGSHDRHVLTLIRANATHSHDNVLIIPERPLDPTPGPDTAPHAPEGDLRHAELAAPPSRPWPSSESPGAPRDAPRRHVGAPRRCWPPRDDRRRAQKVAAFVVGFESQGCWGGASATWSREASQPVSARLDRVGLGALH